MRNGDNCPFIKSWMPKVTWSKAACRCEVTLTWFNMSSSRRSISCSASSMDDWLCLASMRASSWFCLIADITLLKRLSTVLMKDDRWESCLAMDLAILAFFRLRRRMRLWRVWRSLVVAVPNKDLEISPMKSNNPRFVLEKLTCGNFSFSGMLTWGTRRWIRFIVAFNDATHSVRSEFNELMTWAALLQCCDANFVRGCRSTLCVRGIWNLCAQYSVLRYTFFDRSNRIP